MFTRHVCRSLLLSVILSVYRSVSESVLLSVGVSRTRHVYVYSSFMFVGRLYCALLLNFSPISNGQLNLSNRKQCLSIWQMEPIDSGRQHCVQLIVN